MRFQIGIRAIVVTALAGIMLDADPVRAAEELSSIARGGRLYDKWFAENKTQAPTTNHPAYANKAGKYGKADSWRCKECHGWDFLGKDGAYAKGAHFTGIAGIRAAAGRDPAAIAKLLREAPHGYKPDQLSDKDLQDLSLFVSKGQYDVASVMTDGKPKGDAAKGEAYFNTLCAGCHGVDGKKISDAPPLGSVAGNVPEMMHKLLNGQPGEAMPALRALDRQIAVDIVAHLQTLPK